MKVAVVVAATAVLPLASSNVSAEVLGPPGAVAPIEPAFALPTDVRVVSPWTTDYRRELLIVDSIATGTVAGAFAAGTWLFEPEDFHLPMMVGGFGFAGYALGGPLVHLRHGRPGRAALSLGLRILAPAVVSSTLTTAVGLEEHDDGYTGYMFGGMALGCAVAVTLDSLLLVPTSTARTEPGSVTAPVLAPARGGAVIGFARSW